MQSGRYLGSGADPALSLIDLGLPKGIQANARTELTVTLNTSTSAGLVFDLYSPNDFKYVLLDTVTDRLLIGHRSRGAWSVDASATLVLNPGQDYKLLISLAGTTVSTVVDDHAIVGFAYNAVVVDGGFGTLVHGGAASFNDFTLKTSDSRFKDSTPQSLVAAQPVPTGTPAQTALTQAQLDPIVAAAIARWSAAIGGSIAGYLQGVVFVVGSLSGQALAETFGHVVVIDADAAGWGWFVDPTPNDDREFGGAGSDGTARASSSSAAYGRMDLLTVVMHEIGHLLGFQHGDAAAGALMQPSLEAGVRKLPLATAPASAHAMAAQANPSTPASAAAPASVPETASATAATATAPSTTVTGTTSTVSTFSSPASVQLSAPAGAVSTTTAIVTAASTPVLDTSTTSVTSPASAAPTPAAGAPLATADSGTSTSVPLVSPNGRGRDER